MTQSTPYSFPTLGAEPRPNLAERLRWFSAQVQPELERRFTAGDADPQAASQLASSGLLGLTMPPRYGGLGLDYLSLGATCEALGGLDLSYQITVTVHLALTAMTILQWGSDMQRQQWLPALATGERIATFALTEPGAGSDVAVMTARAVPERSGFRLSGEKTWISGANDSSLLLVFATVDPALKHKGITAFLVPRETEGLSTPALHGKLGIRAGDTGSVVLRDAWVPDENILGQIGEGFPIALSALATGLFTVGFGALGIIRECVALTVALVRGADTGSLQGPWQLVKQRIAEMTACEVTSRLLLNRAAMLKNQGRPNQQETSLAKWTAAEGAVTTAGAALRIAQEIQADTIPTIERHLRNAKGAGIYGGTNEIHQIMQGAYATGDRIERPFRLPAPTARDLAGDTAVEPRASG